MLTKNSLRYLALLGSAVILTACSAVSTDTGTGSGASTGSQQDTGTQSETEAAAELTTVTATSGGACICHAPLYVGIEEGFFEERGLTIEFRQLSQGFTAMGALQTGDADVADAVPAVAAQASAEGIEARAALVANGDASGTVDTSEYFAIVARDGSGVAEGDLESLRGKTIGAPVGTIGHQYLYYTLQDAGLDPQSDVTVQNVAPADLVSALQSGSVDAIASWEPVPLTALKNVAGSYEVVRGGGAIQYLFARWMSPRFLEEEPEAAERFVEAYLESMQFARQNPEETAAAISSYFEGLDPAIIEEALSYLNFDPRVSQATLDAAAQGVEFNQALGKLEGDYSFRDNLELELLTSAIDSNPEYVSDLPEIPADLELSAN
ncbi:MAG: aliphatic sulfonate transporter [Actinotalea sp.]|nr:aliphatic sulfonate transporter [Actinotalea sp.]